MVPLVLAALALLPGFHEARALEPAASFVAGKPVQVYCANSFQDWWRTTADLYGQGNVPSAFAESVGGSIIYIGPGFSCALPLQAAAGRHVNPLAPLAAPIETLVHESIHARGSVDEGATDCAAMHEMPRVAVKFFRVKAGKQLRALMAAAWDSHRKKPPQYQSVC